MPLASAHDHVVDAASTAPAAPLAVASRLAQMLAGSVGRVRNGATLACKSGDSCAERRLSSARILVASAEAGSSL
jgi:hypothetical protein